jgi:C-terminal peptidase prc
MRYFALIITILLMACTKATPGVDNPNPTPNKPIDKDIIAYIDKRLLEEYYWLDEVEQKNHLFNREYSQWSNYLANSLAKLETNLDDGYIKSNGQRSFYSYIREYTTSTRAETTGFGLLLHYTILATDRDMNYYCFVVDHVYPGSPASEAGIKRGDMITMIDNSYITQSNYTTLFNAIQGSTKTGVKLQLLRQTTKESFTAELGKATYDESPVAHHELIEIDDVKIGYLVYLGFESEYDEELLAAVQELATQGAQELIIDLRINRGGSVNSAVKLCSALLPATLNDSTLCMLVRNPKNINSEQQSAFKLENAGSIFSLDNITVLCSGYSASASELVIMGLRGLDVPVKLIGAQTEGKNCGMDVTRKSIGGKNIEFAPITFMCFNAKGKGDWGEGIAPDIDLNDEANSYGVHDVNYPMPRTDWGDNEYDIALVVALAEITGKGITTTSTRSGALGEYRVAATIEAPL